MASSLLTIASLWSGSYLSFIERVVLQSYLDRGHSVILYVTEPVKGVPEGVEVRDASDIYLPEFDISDNDRVRVAVYSDIFRLHLLTKTDYIWSDLDAYCVKPYDFSNDWVFGFGRPDQVCTGVLKLPKSSETLAKMLAFVSAPCPIQPWRGKKNWRIQSARQESGEIWGVQDLPWGCSGPKAFTHYLKQTDEISHSMETDVFYPLFGATLRNLFSLDLSADAIEKPASYSVHIFGSTKKYLRTIGGLPPVGSYLEHICKRHGVDPATCPVM